jgi:hypothetical protein
MKFLYPSLFDPLATVEVWFCDAPCCAGKEFHRDDGAAVVFPDGKEEWWHHGTRLTEVEVLALQLADIHKQFLAGTSRPVIVKRPSYPWQVAVPQISAGTPQLTLPPKKGSAK